MPLSPIKHVRKHLTARGIPLNTLHATLRIRALNPAKERDRVERQRRIERFVSICPVRVPDLALIACIPQKTLWRMLHQPSVPSKLAVIDSYDDRALRDGDKRGKQCQWVQVRGEDGEIEELPLDRRAYLVETAEIILRYIPHWLQEQAQPKPPKPTPPPPEAWALLQQVQAKLAPLPAAQEAVPRASLPGPPVVVPVPTPVAITAPVAVPAPAPVVAVREEPRVVEVLPPTAADYALGAAWQREMRREQRLRRATYISLAVVVVLILGLAIRVKLRAEVAGVSRQQLNRLARNSVLGHRVAGRYWAFTRGELEAYKAKPKSKGGRPKKKEVGPE